MRYGSQAANIGQHSPSSDRARRFEPEPWATSDDGSPADDITNMYLPPAAEIKPVETLAPSDDSGLHLKRFSSISKMINNDYNITQFQGTQKPKILARVRSPRVAKAAPF